MTVGSDTLLGDVEQPLPRLPTERLPRALSPSGLLSWPKSPRAAAALDALALGVAVLLLTRLSLVSRIKTFDLAVWRPAGSLAAAALALSPRRLRLRLTLITLLGSLAAQLLVPWDVQNALATAGATALGAWLCATLYTAGGRDAHLRAPADAARLLLCALAASAVSGLLLVVGAQGDALAAWQVQLLSLPAGVLLVGSVLLTSGRQLPRPAASRWWEPVAQPGALAAVLGYLLVAPRHGGMAFVILPVLLWAALRMGAVVVAWELLAVSACVSISFAWGFGTFAPGGALYTGGALGSLDIMQLFLVSTGGTAIVVALASEQRAEDAAALAEGEVAFRRTFDESMLGMLMLDLDPSSPPPPSTGCTIIRANDAAHRILRLPRNSRPRRWDDLLHPDDLQTACAAVAHVRDGPDNQWQGDLRHHSGDLDALWLEIVLSRVHGHDGSQRLALQLADVTDRYEAEARLDELALRDPMTRLPNRTLLLDRTELALTEAARSGRQCALLSCDVDDLHELGADLGGGGSEQVLVEVSRRLSSAVSPGDTVARLGGGGFAVLCPHAGSATAARSVADRLVTSLAEPVVLAGAEVMVRCSVGITMSAGQVNARDLLREAETAMYTAKRCGRRRSTFASDDHLARMSRSVQMEQDLFVAVDRGEFRIHVQPIVDLRTERIVAAETLVRWQHPRLGLLPPGEWLELAESSSVIHSLGRWVLRESCRLAADWVAQVGEDAAPRVHVNVSARQLDLGRLSEDVRASLEVTGLSGDRLVLELTETHLGEVMDSLLEDLDSLAATGLRLSADDFGTGYSPLTRLTDLPVHELKVDRTFVARMGTEERARAVVHAILGMGKALGMHVVAEGVETRAQAEELYRCGCTTAQGYLFSPPRTPEAFRMLLLDSVSHRRVAPGRAGWTNLEVSPARG